MKRFGIPAVLALLGLATAPAFATTPGNGTLTAGGAPVTFTSGPNVQPNPLADCEAAYCDEYTLTVSVPAGYSATHPNGKIVVNLAWDVDVDYDLKAVEGGSEIATAGATGSPEVMNIASTGDGVRTITIQVVPYAVNGGTARATVSFVSDSASGGGNTATPAPRSTETPRYAVHQPPLALSGDTGEPSIGYNPFTKTTFVVSGLKFLFQTRPENLTPSQPEACDGTWVDRSHPFTSVTTLDPIGLADSIVRGKVGAGMGAANKTRVWGGQLTGKTHFTVYTEDDGLNWVPTEGNAPVATGFDHQGIASGPYPTTGIGASIPHPLYPNAFYYCGQDIAYANCTRSDDGGVTFNPPQQMYQLTTCGGLHGHPRVGPDGTVFVPNPNCGGNTGVAVSTDAGTTWTVRKIPDSPGSGYDPQAAIGTDNSLLMCHTDGLGKPLVSVSKDKGATWTIKNKVLGSDQGIEHTAFTQGLAGTAGRYVCAYLGTKTRGNPTAEDFPGIWHLYFSTSYDDGATWHTVNVTPNDPVQGRGGIWDGGGGNINRNLLDFNEMSIDENGYPMYGYSDGCVGSCDTDPTSNSYTAHPRIARQVGGRSLWADKDPTNLAYVPKRACLAGTRDAQASYLSWKIPDNGGHEISNYDIYRGVATGAAVKIATTGPKDAFRDLTADPNVPDYYYVIKAKNSLGDSLFSNEVKLSVVNAPVESLCTLPGKTISVDASGDQSAAGSAVKDALVLSAAEPLASDGKITFTVKLRGTGTLTEGDVYAVRFLVPGDTASAHHWVAMVVQGNTPTFTYGTVEVGSVAVAGYTVYTRTGTLPAGSSFVAADGVIRIVVPHSLFSLTRETQLTGFDTYLFPGGPSVASGMYTHRSQTLYDTMSGGVYSLRNTTFCNPNTAPKAVLAASVDRGPAPLEVTFTLAGSNDAEDSIVEYQFTPFPGAQPIVQTTSAPITHTYTAVGRYGATLKVKDARGLVSETASLVNIEVVEQVEEAAELKFIERHDVKLNSFITSEEVTATGFRGSLPVSVSPGLQYRINGGAFTTSPGNIRAGDTIAVRHISANAEGTTTTSTLKVGALDVIFRSITTTLDHVPDAFGFATQQNVAPGALVESDVLTLKNYDDAQIVPSSGQSYRINGGEWKTTASKLVCGGTTKASCTATVQVRHKANASSLGYTKSNLTVGGVKGMFTTRTRK